MERWVEAADWIVWQLCGSYVRNACTAGYKGILQDGEYPSADFLEELAPGFGGFVADKLEHPIGQLGDRAGTLTAEAAAWTGLPEGIAVAVGNVDAHVTAPAAQAVEPGQMVAIMGTSTCHVMSSDRLREVPGMCGVVDGGIVSGSWGYEAGQSGVGDIFGWFVKTGVPAEYAAAAERSGETVHELLTRLASEQEVGEHGLVALDWHSGNRSVLVDHELSGTGGGPDPGDQAGGHLPRAARGHRLRHARDRRDLPRRGVPVDRVHRRRRAGQEPAADADLRRRAPPPAVGDRLGAGTCSRLGDPRGRRRRCLPPTSVRPPGGWAGCARVPIEPDESRSQSYDRLFAEYLELHDHFGRDVAAMRRLRGSVAMRLRADTGTVPGRDRQPS